MKVVVTGHRYRLANLDDPVQGQLIQFIHKSPVVEGAPELVTVNDGTTNEEVLAVLIDRIQFLQGKFPCRENAIALTKLEEALLWLEKRTAGRKARGVEGTAAA